VRGEHPLKTFGLIKVRDGHLFGLMQITRNDKFKWFKWQKKTWYNFSIKYFINPRGCPPLATISLVQAVCTLQFFSSSDLEILVPTNITIVPPDLRWPSRGTNKVQLRVARETGTQGA
jgi:hypothetical protein